MAIAGRNQIGPFQLVRLVRSGQTTQVWVALDGSHTQRYALKILKEDYRKDRSQVSQMRHEYMVGKDLDDERVIHIFDFNIDGIVPYLVLELFGSRNLKQTINDGYRQVAHKAPQIIEQAAAGLNYFHQQGWVHRDIKPDNYLIDDDFQVKLIDFSLSTKRKSGLTRLFRGRSKVQGTRSFMSPEQIRGGGLDNRSDIYGFGCTVFDLLTGRPPFTAESADELLSKHLKAPVPLLANTNHNITEEFSGLVAQMMAKDQQERPESMENVLHELAQAQIFSEPPMPPGGNE